MIRPLPVIIAALLMTRPGMPDDEALSLAKIVQEVAEQHNFDPFSAIAIGHFESGWRPEVISANGEDYGIGQIRARYIGACKKDPDPKDNPGRDCRIVKAYLLNPEVNVRMMGMLITRNRKFCKKKLGTAWFHQWLASYQGLNFVREKKYCVAKKKTWRVIEYRKKLIREVVHKKQNMDRAEEIVAASKKGGAGAKGGGAE